MYKEMIMSLSQLNETTFLDLDSIALVQFTATDTHPTAKLTFLSGDSSTLNGEAAMALMRQLRNYNGGEPQASMSNSKTTDTKCVDLESLSMPALFRSKAWFHRRDENGRDYILAFINSRGSCTLRTFDAERGIFIAKVPKRGNYQDNFADLMKGATELTVSSQPNLERDCKERLPGELLAYLKKQFGN